MTFDPTPHCSDRESVKGNFKVAKFKIIDYFVCINNKCKYCSIFRLSLLASTIVRRRLSKRELE